MDEIGRGTSTYDGISIAWAVAEYLVTSEQKAKTLFATHYHELQKLEESYPKKIKNYQVAIEDNNGEPVFLHKVIKGGASHSFGIAVAKLAGVPEIVTKKAMEILEILESKVLKSDQAEVFVNENINKKINKHSDTKILKVLNKINILELTPLQAQQKLSELKEISNEQN